MDDKTIEQISCYHVRVVRLINFHNFVDETIPVQGSLFLMGNNGTGKTTIIDAVHLALTGGQQLMYNAATSVGSREEVGRTLAGVILRHDFETGRIGRDTGAVGYVAIELAHVKTGQVASVGVGAFVQGLDQRPETWGFIVDEPLRDVPLTIRAPAADGKEPQHRPVDKRELLDLVGKTHVYDIGRYRTQIGNRFFGGRENFERFADLLKASKSYKDLVVKARDFEGLFALLLPAPDHQVFQDIESTLQSLDKIEADLKALKQEKDLLDEAQRVIERIGSARETIERFRYVQVRSSHDHVDREAANIQRAVHRNEEAIADARAQLETIVPQLERTRGVLAELRIGEPGRLLEELERLNQERSRAQQELAARTAELDAEASREKTLERDRKKAKDECDEALQDQLRTLDRIELPALPAGMTTASADKALTVLKDAYRGIAADAELNTAELRRLQNTVQHELDSIISQLRGAQQPLLVRKTELEREKAAIEKETVGAGPAVEFLPAIPGYAEFAAELDSKNIEWSPLYRLVDFRDKTPDGLMDALEAYMGEAVLGTVFVAPDQLKTVVDIATSRYPNVHVADSAALGTAHDVRLSDDSVCLHLDCGGNDPVRRFLEANLGHVAVVDVVRRGKSAEWLALEGVAYRGRAWHRLAQPTRGLLGSKRRHEAVELKINERHARRTEIDAQFGDVAVRLTELQKAEQQARDIRLSIEERISPWLVAHRIQALQSGSTQSREAKDRAARIKAAVARIQKEIDELGSQIDAIKTNKETETTGDLRKQIETVRKQVLALEREQDKFREVIARHSERLDVARQQLLELDARRTELKKQLDEQRATLHALVPVAHKDELDHYVDVICGGQGLKTGELGGLIREQERTINREIGSLVGLDDETHKGRGGLLHHELLWTKYAFVYDEAKNELRDQNGALASTLYDRLVDEVEKLDGAVNERRRKLLEKTILGDLSNQYTRDLYRLRESLNAVNLMLEGLTFGRAQYKFTQKIKTEYRQVYGIVRRAGAIDPESQKQLKVFFESRLEQLHLQPDGTLPKFLDYRHWFDYQLHIKTTGAADGMELTSDIRRLGSGGEQAVPNYLLIMAMGALLFNQIGAKIRLLLFDEAFYGIDAARRDELLRFASRLGITLVLATPEMDGVTEAMRESTTLLLEKNDKNEVFIGNFTWESKEGTQMDIFTTKERGEEFTVKV